VKLSVIIVNYNVKYFLEQCLCSVQQAIKNIETEIFVIDNCSSDRSIEYLSEKFTAIKFIRKDKNEGFAKANNMALKECSGDYILFLNPDTIISENILQNCIHFFEQYEEAGTVGVRMIDGSGNFLPESKRSFPSPVVSFFKLSGLSSLFPRSNFFNRYALGFLKDNEVYQVDVLCGAFLMAKRDLLLQLNGFDEDFFMYGEDIDLCYRIQQAGYKNYYLGTETIIHFKGESSKQKSSDHVKTFYDAMQVFVKKHYQSSAWITSFFLRTGIYARASVSFISSMITRKKNYRGVSSKNKLLLIGDPFSAAEAEKIIKQNFSDATIRKLQSLQSLPMQEDEFDEIIFCPGRFSYEESIGFINVSKNRYQYMWHGLHTKSVVGSSDKEHTGEVIVGS
jgi:GT2 family glycosyltransferase